MASSKARLQDVRLGDLSTFLAVRRLGSISAAARDAAVTPSQVSKTLIRLEQLLGTKLLVRSTRGVRLNSEAERLAPEVEAVVQAAQALTKPSADVGDWLTLASTSWLTGPVLENLAKIAPELQLRGLILPVTFLRTYASENVFDAALFLGEPRLPAVWAVERFEDVDMVLLGSPRVQKRLGPGPVSVARVAELPFISHLFYTGQQFVPLEDGCPLRLTQRRRGHEVQTLLLALQLAATTDQLVFAPRLAAHAAIRSRALLPIEVDGWGSLAEPLYLACHSERVTQGDLRVLRAAVHAATVEPKA